MFSFWSRNKSGLPGPKELPQAVGTEIVRTLGGDPDTVWNLKAVILPREGKKDFFEVRVYDAGQASADRIAVKDYHTLAEHPALILYEGWYSKSGKAEIKKKG